MWVLSTFVLCVSTNIVMSSVDYLQHPVKSCHIGDSVKNECTKCLCTTKSMFECTHLNCTKDATHLKPEPTVPSCYPNQLYVLNLITCICTKDGKWPHSSCYDTFQSLPPSDVITHECEPDSYVTIDCNVCRCGSDGKINTERCTRNVCEDDGHRRAFKRSNNVYSTCELKNWYSLAPCQFCLCVHKNKLVCNTGNYYSKKLELGSYKLRICGKEYITEAIELIPDNKNLLRLGLNITTPPKHTISTSTTIKAYNGAIDIKSADKVNIVGNNNGSVEYYSDFEDGPQRKQNPTLDASTVTQKPVEVSKKVSLDEADVISGETDEDNDDAKFEYEQVPKIRKVELDLNSISKVKKDTNPGEKALLGLRKGDKSDESYQYVGKTLQINLPKVLNKVFEMALRKSMISLTKETKCTPGTTSVQKCNMCFCLKNGKLLCTNTKC